MSAASTQEAAGGTTTSAPHSLYITLQFLRTVDGVNKFHWAFYVTGNSAPSGHLLHATDTDRQALDLYVDLRGVKDPRRSKTMLVCLKVAASPGLDALKSAASAVRLMDKRYLPRGEPRWTCRVWVKEVINVLVKSGRIKLFVSVDKLEERCLYMGDTHMAFMGRAMIYNHVFWLEDKKKPMAPEPPKYSQPPAGRYTGPKPMVIDTPYPSQPPTGRYFGSKPMITDTVYHSQPPVGRYLGPKPMITETSNRTLLTTPRSYAPNHTMAPESTPRYDGTTPMETESYYTPARY